MSDLEVVAEAYSHQSRDSMRVSVINIRQIGRLRDGDKLVRQSDAERQLEQVTGLLREAFDQAPEMMGEDWVEGTKVALSQQAEPVGIAKPGQLIESAPIGLAKPAPAQDEQEFVKKEICPSCEHHFPSSANPYINQLRAELATRPAQTAPQVPERLSVEPYQTVDRSSTNYKAGWNACRKAMLEGQTAPQPDK